MTWFTRRGLELVPSDLTSYPNWLTDMRQAQLNLLIIHIPHDIAALIDYAASDHFTQLAAQAADWGIDIEWAPHALKDLLPRTAFAEHPEWFRMNLLGERTPDYNMCVSNLQARQVVQRRVDRHSGHAPGAIAKFHEFLSFPVDGWRHIWHDDVRHWAFIHANFAL